MNTNQMTSLYTDCDARRESISILKLNELVADLSRHQKFYTNQLQTVKSVIEIWKINTVKLNILESLKAIDIAIYPQEVVKNVSAELKLKHNSHYENCLEIINLVGASLELVREAYNVFMESLKDYDWNTNSKLLTGNTIQKPFMYFVENSRDIVFYLKVFHKNVKVKLEATEKFFSLECLEIFANAIYMSDCFLDTYKTFLLSTEVLNNGVGLFLNKWCIGLSSGELLFIQKCVFLIALVG